MENRGRLAAAAAALAGLAGLAALLAAGRGRRRLCYCIYYGSDYTPPVLRWLQGCGLAVLPPTAPAAALEARRGLATLAYMSAATLGGWEPWAREAGGVRVVASTEWGERVVDPCSPEWRSLLAGAAEALTRRGYRGVFLDNLDLADRYPWMKPCLEELVHELAAVVDELAVNRGFALLPGIAAAIDYLVFEGYVTGYTPARGYIVYRGRDLAWIRRTLAQALALAGQKGFRVLLLSYAPPGDRGLLEAICREYRVSGHGLPLYVAPGLLQEPGVCNPCPA